MTRAQKSGAGNINRCGQLKTVWFIFWTSNRHKLLEVLRSHASLLIGNPKWCAKRKNSVAAAITVYFILSRKQR
ncbi:hypothetical protein L596_011178 [Steinernema carpocapsae]|uniref:Uncharacterized protein n=1 Tax=Steinernema carpocapsae TaxID=34508 RepID=A0A4U5NU13_STECR|nr:hypothetical protein L596_011178 [Steinernema carpocapsae]